jgi:general secretion pathway protein G
MDKEMKESGRNKTSYQRTRLISGFTLIELLLVMVIIGLLAGFIVPKYMKKIGKSKQTATKAQIELISTALDLYRLDTGKYPSQDTGLQSLNTKPGDVQNWDGPYLKKEKIPKDPWGADYIYKHPGTHGDYDIVSYGADGSEGGSGDDKDIVSWE